jgi:hypothetical protein
MVCVLVVTIVVLERDEVTKLWYIAFQVRPARHHHLTTANHASDSAGGLLPPGSLHEPTIPSARASHPLYALDGRGLERMAGVRDTMFTLFFPRF